METKIVTPTETGAFLKPPYATVSIALGDNITETVHTLTYYAEKKGDKSVNVENVISAMIQDGLIDLDSILKCLGREIERAEK